ncbi:MAG: hypothetical protein SGARI_005865, partial [Bacillariaceae sp.]
MFRISHHAILAAVMAAALAIAAVSATPIPDRGEVVLQFPTDHSNKKNASNPWMGMAVEELKNHDAGGGDDGTGRRGLNSNKFWYWWMGSQYNSDGWLYCTVRGNAKKSVLREALKTSGAFQVNHCSRLGTRRFSCTGFLDTKNVAAVSDLDIVTSIMPVFPAKPCYHCSHGPDDDGDRHLQEVLTPEVPPPIGGSVKNRAVQALQVDKVRAKYPELTGAGMKIGVISSSFNTRGGYDADVASGDLPSDVVVLQDAPFRMQDDGRAMLQLIHDLAPDAALYFHADGGNPFDFPVAVQRLADEGCDVIVDDV